MKLHVLLMAGLGLLVTGCAEKERATPEPAEPAPAAVAPSAAEPRLRNAGFLAHMHRHAEKLDDLNFALADGDLDAAQTPAWWLARHETYEDVPSEWLPFLYGMRTQAEAVGAATDLATAGAAAEQITVQCQGCHAAAGADIE